MKFKIALVGEACMRLSTGPFRPDPDDWMGVFIRGDEALALASALRAMVRQEIIDPQYAKEGSILNGLIKLLESCREIQDRTSR